MALLEGRSLTAGYGAGPVISSLDIEVDKGEVVALLGPNGAGKSTTLKTLSGAHFADEGEVKWDGAATRAPLHRRAKEGLAYISEERCVFARLSTADNIRVGDADTKIVEALFPELTPRMKLKAGSLSGGEQQMLAVGRALGRRPRALLADELSLGLAPMVVDRILGVLRKEADDGLAVLLVEQHARKVLEVADRVYVIQNGQIKIAGTASEIRNNWDEVVASYLGK